MLLYHLGSHSHRCHRHLNAERMIAVTHTATDRIAQRKHCPQVYVGIWRRIFRIAMEQRYHIERKTAVKQHTHRVVDLAKPTHAGRHHHRLPHRRDLAQIWQIGDLARRYLPQIHLQWLQYVD